MALVTNLCMVLFCQSSYQQQTRVIFKVYNEKYYVNVESCHGGNNRLITHEDSTGYCGGSET